MIDFKKHNTEGLLITFCGLDGCGKTTMIDMLCDYLNTLGLDHVLTKQPTDSVRQSSIFRTFMDAPDNSAYSYRSLSLLAASDRLQHSNKTILPLLEKGSIVISDRYFYSCLANLRARGYTNDRWIYEIAKDIPKPDIAFFLSAAVETAVSRVRSRAAEKDKWIDTGLQYKLHSEYISIAESAGGHLISSESVPDSTFEKVKSIVDKELESKYGLFLQKVLKQN